VEEVSIIFSFGNALGNIQKKKKSFENNFFTPLFLQVVPPARELLSSLC